MAGQIRIRVRYRDLSTAWFDYLMVSRTELEDLLDGTGWRLARTLDSEDTYIAIIEKERLVLVVGAAALDRVHGRGKRLRRLSIPPLALRVRGRSELERPPFLVTPCTPRRLECRYLDSGDI